MKLINVVMLVFLDEDGSIELNRRNDAVEEVWGLLGGGVEESEDPVEALKREILEELHYSIDEDADDLVLLKSFQTKFSDYIANVSLFKAKFPGFHKFSDSDEVAVSDLKVFPITRVLDLPLLPLARQILDDEKFLVG